MGTGRVEASVVVGTRGRADDVRRALASILANVEPQFEVIVVDQSSDHSTEAALRPALSDRRVRLIRAPGQGASLARNIGIASCRGEIVALTDDDCEVSPTWVRDVANAFNVDSRVGLVFGNVVAARHDPDQGLLPSYVRSSPALARGLRDKHRVEGLSACMGLRRSVWKLVGGFDERMGPGAEFRAGEDPDFMLRALAAGCYVYETPAVEVLHHGFRPWEQGKSLIEGYMFGLGAALAKRLRLAPIPILSVYVRFALQWARRSSKADLGGRPTRLLRLRGFLRGTWRGLLTPVEARSGRFAAEQAQ